MGLTEYIFKARSGVYKDTAENRRLHRVGQRYGDAPQKPDGYSEDDHRNDTVREYREKAEKFLSSMEGIDFRYIGSSTTNGASVYFRVSRKGGKGEALKFRISDHSVTNVNRVQDEIHYNRHDPEMTRSQIYYEFGFPGYKYGRTMITMPSGRKLPGYGYYKESVHKSLTSLYLLKPRPDHSLR